MPQRESKAAKVERLARVLIGACDATSAEGKQALAELRALLEKPKRQTRKAAPQRARWIDDVPAHIRASWAWLEERRFDPRKPVKIKAHVPDASGLRLDSLEYWRGRVDAAKRRNDPPSDKLGAASYARGQAHETRPASSGNYRENREAWKAHVKPRLMPHVVRLYNSLKNRGLKYGYIGGSERDSLLRDFQLGGWNSLVGEMLRELDGRQAAA